ncbi:hypothetical protein DKX38_010549 [Salix brachista]|uniref:U-box domain-containing protein n=1 Tax=Salix brachista TaxID=2182728 RepID=A0A5N5MDW0_9ROSI|nr:hypothetical protein DKX38_010549 [Salix brachista]
MHSNDLKELLHLAELQLTTGSETEQLSALYLLERSLVPDPPSDPVSSPELMRGVVANLKNKAGVKPATKILLALCLAEANRHVAVEAGAVGTVVEVAMELDGASAERALAALELTCTVSGGAAELRAHALAVPVMVTMMGKMVGRGKEYAISALAVIYGSGGVGSDEEQTLHAPPEEVARAVTLALQGDCTARGRRKGAQLLKALQEYGRIDSTQEGNEQPTKHAIDRIQSTSLKSQIKLNNLSKLKSQTLEVNDFREDKVAVAVQSLAISLTHVIVK